MPIEIIAWYEGLPIEVSKEFHKNDVVIYLIYKDGEPVHIEHRDPHITINSLQVKNEGDNEFEISYQIDSKTYLKDKFIVTGYVPKKYVDEEFQVVYIDSIGNRIDFTDEFYQLFHYDADTLIISWSLFLNKVIEMQQYGKYEVIAPKNSGLFHSGASLWDITCDKNNSIKAVLTKVFNK